MKDLHLSGKRLLVLGGSNNALDIRRYCDETGVILLAAGHPVADRMAAVADETYEADIYKRDQVKQVAIDSKAEGIFVCGNVHSVGTLITILVESNAYKAIA